MHTKVEKGDYGTLILYRAARIFTVITAYKDYSGSIKMEDVIAAAGVVEQLCS